jgi:hypothetical protein
MHNKSFTPSNFSIRYQQMGKRFSLPITILLLIALLFANVNAIVPSHPIVVSPNT